MATLRYSHRYMTVIGLLRCALLTVTAYIAKQRALFKNIILASLDMKVKYKPIEKGALLASHVSQFANKWCTIPSSLHVRVIEGCWWLLFLWNLKFICNMVPLFSWVSTLCITLLCWQKSSETRNAKYKPRSSVTRWSKYRAKQTAEMVSRVYIWDSAGVFIHGFRLWKSFNSTGLQIVHYCYNW